MQASEMELEAGLHKAITIAAIQPSSQDSYRDFAIRLADLQRRDLSAKRHQPQIIEMRYFGAGVVVLSALHRELPYTEFHKAVAAGDMCGLLERSDIDKALSDAYFGVLPDMVAKSMREQREMAQKSFAALPCGAGCWFCCAAHKHIQATAAEAMAVWEAVENNSSEAHAHPQACPALGADGMCRAYEVRPQGCRTRASIDVEACRADLEGGVESTTSKHTAHMLSPFDSHEIARILSRAAGIREPFVNLLASLRSLRDGDRPSVAMTKGRRSHKRHEETDKASRRGK